MREKVEEFLEGVVFWGGAQQKFLKLFLGTGRGGGGVKTGK